MEAISPNTKQIDSSSSSSTYCSTTEALSPISTSKPSSSISVSNKDIIDFISDNIVNKINKNLKKFPNASRNPKDILYSENVPKISISNFFKRIVKYTRIEDSTLIAIVIYLKRFLKKSKLMICHNNIYNCILGLTVLAIKYNENVMFKNDYYAQIGGLDVKDLDQYEYYLFRKLDYKLHIIDSEYYDVVQKIFKEKQ